MQPFLQKIQNLKLPDRLNIARLDRRVLIFCHDIVAIFAAMQLSMWLSLKEELQLLEPGFVLKESLIFALIASGFFLWFQTYKGIWRYVSWRQSALLVGVLGFASLIFFPLLTKAHMQPISIPAVTVLINWGIASLLLVGSRAFFRVFHERWSVADESLLTDIPMARVIVVGGGSGTKQFLKSLKRQKTQLYDVLGYVESNPKLDATLEGVDVLGSLADLPGLIENFNAEGIHPHHIVFADSDYWGTLSRTLLKNLSAFKVSFLKAQDGSSVLQPMAIEDVFYEPMDAVSLDALTSKNVLIYGATCPLGEEISAQLSDSKCSNLILWDHNTEALAALKTKLSASKVSCLSQTNYDASQLAHYLKEQEIDAVLNLRAFSALAMEPHDSALSYEVYIEENERFAAACQESDVSTYCFVTQEEAHGTLAKQLSPVAGHLLKMHSKGSKSLFAAVNMPYVIASQDAFFQGTSRYNISQKELSVVSPAYGAQMLGQIISSVVTKTPWSGGDQFHMETVTYEALAELYGRLNHNAPRPTYVVAASPAKTISWNEEYYKNAQASLKKLDYKGAAENLGRLYA